MNAVYIITLFVVAFTILYLSGLLRPIENGFRWLTLPLARALAAIGFEIDKSGKKNEEPAVSQDRLKELESRLSILTVDYVKLRALEEENRSLRKVAAFIGNSEYDHVGARVIARSTEPRIATILIDRGATDGLEIGMPVIAENGIFVGKVIFLNERTSTVLLVSDERSRLAASLSGVRELIGLVQGNGNNVARLTFIPQTLPLKTDDVIVTAGTEEKIPANLTIALVNKVDGKPTDPFKTATLEPLARVDQLDMVLVLRPTVLRPVE